MSSRQEFLKEYTIKRYTALAGFLSEFLVVTFIQRYRKVQPIRTPAKASIAIELYNGEQVLIISDSEDTLYAMATTRLYALTLDDHNAQKCSEVGGNGGGGKARTATAMA
jgi:hypothetical protein